MLRCWREASGALHGVLYMIWSMQLHHVLLYIIWYLQLYRVNRRRFVRVKPSRIYKMIALFIPRVLLDDLLAIDQQPADP